MIDFDIPLTEILKTDNIATKFKDEELNKIGMVIQETYKADLESCEEEFEVMENCMELTMQKYTIKENQPNTNIPLIWMASQRFGADAYPALVRDESLVKAKVIGNDEAIYMKDPEGGEAINPQTNERVEVTEGGEKLKKGERIAGFENYILIKRSPNFITTIDESLNPLAILGTMFKKTYFDPYIKKIVSKLVYPIDIVVNVNAKNIEDYPVSQIIKMTQNKVKQRMISGEFIEYEMIELLESNDTEEGKKNEKNTFSEHDKEIVLIEQHTKLDLDGDGYKEPYIIICSLVNNKILSITKRFTKDSIQYFSKKKKKVLEIKSYNYFTKYIFIPNPKGTFYGVGFGFLLYKLNLTVNATINQLLLAGINANLTRGFIDASLRMKGGDLVLEQNEWKVLNPHSGISIRDGIVPLDSKEPSQTLYQLMVYLVDVAKQLANITDILEGNVNSSMQPGTMLAAVEQGMKEFKSIYKRVYRSLTKEIEKVHEIIASDPEGIYSALYEKVLDYPEDEMDFKKDYKKGEFDIVLTADTEVITNIERVSKANLLVQFIGNQQINQYHLMKRILSAFRIKNLDELIIKPQPQQPDPMQEALKKQVENEEIKANAGMIQAKEKVRENSIKAVNSSIDAQVKKAQVGKIKAETMKTLADAEAVEEGVQLNKYKAQAESLVKDKELKIKETESKNKVNNKPKVKNDEKQKETERQV